MPRRGVKSRAIIEMELNPNHPVTKAMRDHWHKIVAMMMLRAGEDHVVFTDEDIKALAMGDKNIVLEELADGLHIRLVSDIEVLRLAKERGGAGQS